jgi:citrate lyase beta subunit
MIVPHFQGACLYVPAVHPKLEAVVAGRAVPGLRVVVVCLEDALAEADVGRAMETLRALVIPPIDGAVRPAVYVRPRHIGMLRELLQWKEASSWTGVVLPKLTVASADAWMRALLDRPTRFMPILESADVLCPSALRELCDVILAPPTMPLLDAVRIGATDLFAVLGTRRPRGTTIYDSVLGPTICQTATYLMSRGVPVTAPVCEALHADPMLFDEVRRDVEAGFVGKTAVHPAQVQVIHRQFAVPRDEYTEAMQILGGDAAVFQSRGAMCESAPHAAWARRVRARAEAFGFRDEPASSSLESARGARLALTES